MRSGIFDGCDRRSGFSLVEMLLVVAIIGILISLLMPALNGARNSAMEVSTASMMADLTSAAQRFGNDNAGRNPGYFSESDMGNAGNIAVGMSAMENAMIELGGTAVVLGREGDPLVDPLIDPENGVIALGPRDPTVVPELPRVVINMNNIGAEGAYFVPDPKRWVAQEHGEGGQAGNAWGEVLSDPVSSYTVGQVLMPDLLDAWGNPMLVWSQDRSARGSIMATNDPDEVYTQFVRQSSDGVGMLGATDGPAWFYLTSNAAFLDAESFGPADIDMGGDPEEGIVSVIGSGVDTPHGVDQRIRTLAAVLASPSAFMMDPAVDKLEDATFDQVYPSVPRGKFVVHSAGSDGVFLSNQGKGWKSVGNTNGGFRLDFGNNYISQDGVRNTDDKGAYSNIDVFEMFDDMLVGSK